MSNAVNRLPSAKAVPPRGGEHWTAYACHFIDSDFDEAVLWYLIAAKAYYWLDVSIFPDSFFDFLSVKLLEKYDSLYHPYKFLISKADLGAGTLLLAEDQYPRLVQRMAEASSAVTRARKDKRFFDHKHHSYLDLLREFRRSNKLGAKGGAQK